MIKGRRRAFRRVHRARSFPSCLPETGLEAVYLGNVLPSSTGLITDESGKGNDAQLVQAPCGYFDGVASYAKGSTAPIHDGKSLYIRGYVKPSRIDTTQTIVAKYKGADREFLIRITADGKLMAIFVSGVKLVVMATAANFILNEWNSFSVSLSTIDANSKTATLTLNGVSLSRTLEIQDLPNTASALNVGAWGDEYEFLKGAVSDLEVGYSYFQFSESNGGYIYDLNLLGNLVLTNTTLDTFWKTTTQDSFFPNELKGCDLWENGIAGEEIRVPIGVTCLSPGYTFSSTNPAGAWLNDGGAKIQLPATLTAVVSGDVPNPLSYEEFAVNFNLANIAFSNIEENKHKYLVFYDSAQSASNVAKILKCLEG